MSTQSPDSETRGVAAEPTLQQRPAQRYVGIHMRLAPDAFKASIDDGFPELFAWLAARGIDPAGPPFIRYFAMEPGDGSGAIADLDLGVPIAVPAEPDGWVHAGELPAGQWAVATHVGSYDGLHDATAALGAWARAQGLEQVRAADGRAAGWVEHYRTDPRSEPDQRRWRTDVAVLVELGAGGLDDARELQRDRVAVAARQR